MYEKAILKWNSTFASTPQERRHGNHSYRSELRGGDHGTYMYNDAIAATKLAKVVMVG